MARATRPGGTIALTAWLASGAIWEAGRVLRAAFPAGDGPPPRWEDAGWVSALLAAAGGRDPRVTEHGDRLHGGLARGVAGRAGRPPPALARRLPGAADGRVARAAPAHAGPAARAQRGPGRLPRHERLPGGGRRALSAAQMCRSSGCSAAAAEAVARQGGRAGEGAEGARGDQLGQAEAGGPGLHDAAPRERVDLERVSEPVHGPEQGRVVGRELVEAGPAAGVAQPVEGADAGGQPRPDLALEEGGPLVGEAVAGRVAGRRVAGQQISRRRPRRGSSSRWCPRSSRRARGRPRESARLSWRGTARHGTGAPSISATSTAQGPAAFTIRPQATRSRGPSGAAPSRAAAAAPASGSDGQLGARHPVAVALDPDEHAPVDEAHPRLAGVRPVVLLHGVRAHQAVARARRWRRRRRRAGR